MRKTYVVRVNRDNDIFDVKTDADTHSFKEMKDIYNKTKDTIKSGTVTLLSINDDNTENLIYSKNVQRKEKIDEVIDSLIDNLNWLLTYKENADEVMSAIDISRDAHLKKVELYGEDINCTNIESKESIFDELQEILSLRRKIKYSKLLVENITNRVDLSNLKNILTNCRDVVKEKPSVNVSTSSVNILEKETIKDVFDLEDINKIKLLKKKNDKIILLNNSITPIKKVNTNNENKENKDKDKKTIKSDECIEEVLHEGNSYKKIKGNKILFKKSIINNYKSITPELKRKYNYIVKIDGKVYGYLYKKEYNGMALVETHTNFTDSTLTKKLKEFSEVKIVDGKLYCLSEGIS